MINITGKRFGKLVGIKRLTGTGKWLFKCDCGNEKAILTGNVTNREGGTISCGCVGKGKTLERLKLK